jgi:hypothetical protein
MKKTLFLERESEKDSGLKARKTKRKLEGKGSHN